MRRLLLLPLLLVMACDTAEPARIVEGVDLDALFAPPTEAERQALLAEWATRDVSAQEVQTHATFPVDRTRQDFDVRVVSHAVGGVTHYGALLVPQGLRADTTLPVVVYAHGGDGGIAVEDAANLLELVSWDRRYVWVVPSFRDEPLTANGQTYRSEGPASPWDRDADDALALLNVALQTVPQADPQRVGVFGISRGGGVALLMAVRDARIRRVLDLFGPTDFFDGYVQDIVEDALRAGTYDLPGFDVLNARFVQPLKAGAVTIPQMRTELLRRSPVYWPERLPAVQVHHGDADETVDVSQSRRLASVMRGRSDFAYYEWPDGEHNPLTFPTNWLYNSQAFIGGL